MTIRIATQFGLPASGTAVEFACALDAHQTPNPEANAELGFDLLPTLAALGIAPLPELFVNWARLEHIDALQTADVTQYFDDLWYPADDDFDLFDASLGWVVSI